MKQTLVLIIFFLISTNTFDDKKFEKDLINFLEQIS